jgi:predicted acyltransferase
VIDVGGRKRWAFPLVVFGMNSIAAYFMASWLSPDVRKAIAPFVGTLTKPPEWVAAVGSPDWLVRLFVAGPVVIAVLTTLVIWLICLWLYRRKIFFKV